MPLPCAKSDKRGETSRAAEDAVRIRALGKGYDLRTSKIESHFMQATRLYNQTQPDAK